MKKTTCIWLILICSVSLVLACPVSYADSLWSEEASSPYSTSKIFSVGNVITVMIIESSSALHQAGTDTGIKDDLAMRFNHTIQSLYDDVGPRNEIALRGENKYSGSGKTSRSSNIQAKVSAIVTKVFPNGNLAILGRHSVEINSELEEITITGIIRSKDVSISNTVFSYQVAESNIKINGTGAIADAENPGFFTRIINWLF
jgi:flagellar L-ring protein precursor FlgH